MTKVAAIQMTSCAAVGPNLMTVDTLVEQAASTGAALVVLPENFAFMGVKSQDALMCQEPLGQGRIQDFLSECAQKHGVWIIAGSVPISCPNPERVYATTLVYNDYGEQVAHYNKLHLFDAYLPETGETYRESDTYYPGDHIQTVDTPAGKVGLSICYDLRFPEFYRAMREEGADFFVVPSAFVASTGRAHWRSLLKVRAIENQAYVIAPNQFGVHDSGRETYGHSMIVGPWGDVLSTQAFGMGVVYAEIEKEVVEAIREQFPTWSHRRNDVLKG